MILTVETAKKILAIVDFGLVAGKGVPKPGELCIEAAVCLALGEPHGDRPSCVAEPDRDFKIRLNDSPWTSSHARARGMRRLSVQQLGTAGMDRSAWIKKLAELTIRRVLPEALYIAAKASPKHSGDLLEAAQRCSDEGTYETANSAYDAAAAANASAAAYAAYAAAGTAYAAANAAASAAAYSATATAAASAAADSAADAAAYAADSAAYAADSAADAAAYAAYAAKTDSILTISARCAEEAYELTGSPGVELLREIEAEVIH